MRERKTKTHFSWMAGFAMLAGCGGTGTRPDDMSAPEHRAAALRAERRADDHRNHAAVGAEPRQGTSRHFAMSASFRARAAEHRAAAQALNGVESELCSGIPDAVRNTCPLMDHPIILVENTSEGVRVTYGGVEAAELGRHARCHAAHGAAQGHESMAGCPLFRPSLQISTEPAAGGAVLDLRSADPAVRGELQSMYEVQPE